MDELDLSGVDPLRWDEVRRRVAVIRSYLAIPHPTKGDRQAHADRLDRSVNQFMALVRAWRQHRSAARIAASGTHRRRHRSPGHLSVDPVARRIAADAIEELGTDATLSSLSRLVRTRCEARGVTPPSDSTIWNMVRAERRGRASGETGVVIGTCMVRLPVATPQSTSQPMLTLAVRASDKAILAASLGTADWTSAGQALAAANAEQGSARVDRDLIGQRHAAGLSAGVEAVTGAASRSALSRILGLGIDDLPLIYRPAKAAPAERLLTTREDRPLSPADARALIVAAVSRHNAAMGASDATWIDDVRPS